MVARLSYLGNNAIAHRVRPEIVIVDADGLTLKRLL